MKRPSSLRPDLCDALVFAVVLVALLLARCVDAPDPGLFEAPRGVEPETTVALALGVQP